MKPNFFQKLMLSVLILTLSATSTFTQAQSDKRDKKTNLRIKVSENENGKIRDIEKNYRVEPMSDEERKEFVDKVLDSLGVDSKKGSRVSVTIEDENGESDRVIARRGKKVIIDHRDNREPTADNWRGDFSTDFNFDTESFRSHWKDLERDITPKAKIFMRDMENLGDRMGDIWEKDIMKPANVRALSVYSNNPDNGVLNLRFSVPQKGDVTVSVTDTKGKEVGKKEIKDFEGEFVGQIELKKSTKGTVFVSVVQNEDGAVKRVVIP